MARRHTPDQVIVEVRKGQKLLNEGHPMIKVIRELQITEATWYRWLNQYGSKEKAEAGKRTQELEKENARLKNAVSRLAARQRHPDRGGYGKILSPEPRRLLDESGIRIA